jgi:hypothetical protein
VTFPTIPDSASGRIIFSLQANTTATRTFPNLGTLTKNPGDLLIAICVCYQSSLTANVFSGWGTGWTEFHDSAGSSLMCVGMAYKWSTGSETGTFSVTQGGTITGHAALLVMSIPGAHATSPPEAGSRASGTSTAADPAAFSPSWGADDNLWIAVGGAGETSTTGSFTGLNTAPTNYAGYFGTNFTSDVVGGTGQAVAFRQLNAASEDVAGFGVDTSNARNAAVVIAVRPAPAAVPEDSPGLEASGFGPFDGIASGDTITSVTATVGQWQSATAGMSAPTYELWDGTTARIGSAQAGSVATATTNTDSVTWTGVAYAQLADLRLGVGAVRHGPER